MTHCPNCGMENREGAKFCKGCRSALTESYVQVDRSPQEPAASAQPAYQPPVAAEAPASAGKSKTPFIIGGVAGVVILCCLALVIVGVILAATGVFGDLFGPQQVTAKVIPAETGFFSTVNPSVANSEGFLHLAEVYEDAIEDAELDRVIEDMEDELDIKFEEDIQPWLGPEVSVAILNLEDAAEGEDPVVVLAAATRNKEASDAFLEKVKESLEDQDYDVEEKTYSGVTYYAQEVQNDWETPTVFGTVGKAVVITTDVDAMEDIIDTQQGNSDSLVKNPQYTELRKALPKDASMHMFFSIEDIAPLAEETEMGVSQDQLEGYQNLGMAITVDKEGIQIDAAVTFDPTTLPAETVEAMKAQSKANAGNILQEIPDDAIGFVASRDLASAWQIALNTIEENPETKEQLDLLSQSFGIDLDADLLAWATGEYALAVVKAKGAEIPVGLFATFEVEDEDAAKKTMDDIVEAIEEQGGDFDTDTIEGVEVQVLTDPYTGDILLGYGFADQHLVIGFTEDGIEQGVGDVTPITEDETFKAVRAHLPSQNTGYFYINVERTLDLIPDDTFYDDEALAFVDPIKAIGGAAAVTNPDSGVSKGTLFIYIP
jgi:hypothetical protein